jgi:hypothetical protein
VKPTRAIGRLWCSAAAFAAALAALVIAVSRGPDTACALCIPAGPAAQTLKEFARQAQVQIVFDARSVEGVVTNAVDGRMEPAEALERMVRGTPLYLELDHNTGAFAIIRRGSTGSWKRGSSILYAAAGHAPAGIFVKTTGYSSSRIL